MTLRKENAKPDHGAGFTLVELMIGILIAMLTMMLVTQVYSNTIWRKRDIAGSSDAQQTAAVTMYQLANQLKQTGSMVAHSSDYWGCVLSAAKGGATLLPIPGALSAPFADLPATLRLAPVAVRAGATNTTSRESDTLLIMSAGLEASGIAFSLLRAPSGATMSFPNSNGLAANDLLLTTDSTNCNITQVASTHATAYTSDHKLKPTPDVVSVDGDYAMSGALTNLNADNKVFSLGKTPQFVVYGVDPNAQSLKSYDLLQIHGLTEPTPIAENVFLFRVLYGITSGSNSFVNNWVSPAETGWTFADLQANTDDARKKLNQIKAIRIALVTRSSYTASTDSFQDQLVLFKSVSPDTLHQTIDLTNSERRFRYQIYESVVPLFNKRGT